MKPAAARLLLFSTATAYRRLLGIVAGVALGVGMLLILLGTYVHMPDRDARASWQDPVGGAREFAGETLVPIPPSATKVLLRAHVDYFDGSTFAVVTVAATQDTTVEFPAGLTPPQPGEYYASPAMARVIAENPSDELGARFGSPVGELPESIVRGPNERVVLLGADWDTLSRESDARATDRLTSGEASGGTFLYRAVLAIGAVALLIPIALLISIVSQLGAAQRRERLATVRLIGAGRRGVAALAGLEMGLASLFGGALGIGVAALLRPGASALSINGTNSFGADLAPSTGLTALSIVLVGLLGAGTAWWRTLKDDVGAPGATRERPEKVTTSRRVIPLAIGIAIFASSAFLARVDGTPGELLLLGLVAGFALTAFGIVFAGSWITMATSRAYGRFARSASGVVAAGRLARHPRATFRSVAGVVVAVFIVSVLTGVAGSLARAAGGADVPGLLRPGTVVAYVDDPGRVEAVVAALNGVEGVDRAVISYAGEDDDAYMQIMTAEDALAVGAIDVPETATVRLDVFSMLAGTMAGPDDTIPAPEAAGSIAGLVPDHVFAITDGTPGAIERARTVMIQVMHPGVSPTTRADFVNLGAIEATQELSVLAYLGMAIAIGISALALTVATVAAALDRKRTFGLLRLGGMPVSELRKSVTTEAALPLGATLLASGGLGFLVAWILVRALDEGAVMSWPDARYWWAMLGSVAVAALAVAGSFGAVRRSTEVVSTRFE